jgi:hypothetical protein
LFSGVADTPCAFSCAGIAATLSKLNPAIEKTALCFIGMSPFGYAVSACLPGFRSGQTHQNAAIHAGQRNLP